MPTVIHNDARLFAEPHDCAFYPNPQGFLALRFRQTDFARVQLRRALPFSEPNRYLSVLDLQDNEICLLESLDAFAPEVRALLQADLDARYFCPEITAILGVKDLRGTCYFDLRIGDFKKTATVQDVTKNLARLPDGRLLLTDVDGNRYWLASLRQAPRKARRLLAPFLY